MIRVGPAGWSYADWEGPVHPRPKPRGYHGLDLLASVFDCLEINSSFYRFSDPQTCQRWLDRIEQRPNFRFTAKLHRDFTHERERRFATPGVLTQGLQDFRDAHAPLLESNRFGALLLQFPQSFRPGSREVRYLQALIAGLGGLDLVVELRDKAWYVTEHLAGIERSGVSLASIDLPRAAFHPPEDFPGLGPIGYLRLHGRNAQTWFDPAAGRDQRYDYAYPPEELQAVGARLVGLGALHDQTYAITNNHFSGQAVKAGVELLALLGQPPADLPGNWIDAFPGLASVAPARPRGELF